MREATKTELNHLKLELTKQREMCEKLFQNTDKDNIIIQSFYVRQVLELEEALETIEEMLAGKPQFYTMEEANELLEE